MTKSFFRQNHCHVCHTRFGVFLLLPFCCVSSLITQKKNEADIQPSYSTSKPNINNQQSIIWLKTELFHAGPTPGAYDPFRGKLAVLFINLLGKGLTQEISGDRGS